MRHRLAALLLLAASTPLNSIASVPSFKTEDLQSIDAGYLQLQWEAEEGADITLQRSRNADFSDPVTVYQGKGRALFVSGLAEGDVYFRLEDSAANASDILTIKVRHQSLKRALYLMLLGGLTTLATIFVIIKGARNAR
ncbi:MAG: hypothetical protein CME88_15780 [Hirschia sp.]|nr:hypothetical protein [Hirschia sp.]MBF19839.1 hypothetical protein [Hirschia sp.]